MTRTPASLLERLRKAPDEGGWARFVELYTPLLYYWGRRVGLKQPDAADLVQDVFVLLVRKLPEFSYDRHKRFRSWLRTVTLNKWRENARRSDPLTQAATSQLPDLPAEDGAAQLWESEYQQHLVGRALELMQDEFEASTWKAFWECVACGRPAREVGGELGISVNAVYVAKSRVLGRLRQELDGLMD